MSKRGTIGDFSRSRLRKVICDTIPLCPDAGGSLTVEEVDGTPTVSDVTTIKVSDGTLTDDGSGTVTITTAGTGAPDDAQYVVLDYDGDLSNERKLTGGTGITLVDAGAGSTVTINNDYDDTPSDAKYVVLEDHTGLSQDRVLTGGTGITLVDAGANDAITINNDYDDTPSDAKYVVLEDDSALTQNRVLTGGTGITINDAGAGEAITINADNNGDVTGPASNTLNAIVKFSGTTGKIVQNSGCTIDGSNNMTVGGNLKVSGNEIQASDGGSTITMDTDDNVTIAGDLNVHGNDIVIKFDDSNYVTLSIDSVGTLTIIPTGLGADGQGARLIIDGTVTDGEGNEFEPLNSTSGLIAGPSLNPQ